MLKRKNRNLKVRLYVVLASILLAGGVFVGITRFEGEAPTVTILPENSHISANTSLQIDVSDHKSGLRTIDVKITQKGKTHSLLSETMPDKRFSIGSGIRQKTIKLAIVPKKMHLENGSATLQVEARDCSWRSWLSGNQTVSTRQVTIDTRKPHVRLMSRSHNLVQGGSGCVIFKVSEPCSLVGVEVGNNFFPAYPAPSKSKNQQTSTYVAFIGLRHDQGPDTEIFIKATDLAGNSKSLRLPKYIRKANFRKDTIEISDRFLNRKMPEFDVEVAEEFASNDPLLGKFLQINRNVRKANYLTITQWGKQSTPKILWEGVFLRLPKSARRASFADHREYRYHGKIVDDQYHLGIDLASLANSPVPAANSGKVLFTGYVGIYGETVIIDHGYGLLSTYSHLSSIETEPGTMVNKGDIIGHTGTTGLAGGDHLHFGIIVHNIFVNPVEWWDSHWIQNNISSKLELLK